MTLAFSACRNEDNRIEPTCFDEVKNQGELGIDCGGPCPECPPSCEDRILNGDELGIDCGGESCQPCATCDDNIQNAHWRPDLNLTMADFNSNDSVGMAFGTFWRLVLEKGVDCGAPCDTFCVATCDDGIQNGDETGIDCGGTNCLTDCPPPTCGDGRQNGQETGIDCGAPGCPDCPTPTCNDGIRNIHIEYIEPSFTNPDGFIVVVETGIDCDEDFETSCPDCPIPTCFDGLQNGTETGVDCDDIPNNFCPPCDPVASCGNGYQDGTEIGVDCDDDPLTPCPPCATCSDGFLNGPELEVDCVDWPIPEYDGGACVLCVSCHDGVQNQLEQAIDCGGPNCEPCEQFIRTVGNGIGQASSPSAFEDQQSMNALLGIAEIDTISVTGPTGSDGLVVEGQFGFVVRIITATAVQEFAIPNTETRFRKTLKLYIPVPDDIGENVEYPLASFIDLGANLQPSFCMLTNAPDNLTPLQVGHFFYTEELIGENAQPPTCYVSAPLALTNMRYDYIYDDIMSGADFYVSGTIDAVDMISLQVTGGNLLGICDGIEFAFNYPGF